MAILASRTKTGISWITESIALFKQAPRQWLLLALVYIGLFVLLPSIPGLQIFAFITILIWPLFIAIAMRMYRNVEVQSEESLSTIMQFVQPKIRVLIMLGFVHLLYFILVSILLSADMKVMAGIIDNQQQLSEQELTAALQTMMPILFKLFLMFIPLIVASWFAPMLIAFNGYPLGKAIKSSIAGSLQYMLALMAAWLLLSAAAVTLLMLASLLLGIFAVISPAFVQSLAPVLMFGCLLLSVAVTLAFQYVSYRDVFRGATSI